ncbi:LLM class F420-dependent oxidoreductase [Luteipulveratus sp. YIM 133132]|uniref:LLM class F420-dependent oxidoreductase n=1 Tax=Luteipulveratus flavus TaxID=3031728 RepID=UPI0023B0DBD2|nr:LLM class F420-dependent oxidoreductase [Luteipulveratus sp. YIM 133132]MDE9366788.1 LLM class F420-dependent oxidoreductase [Luteipulveratus sp. YIM 133132]
MTRPLRIAVQLQPQHADYAQIRDAVRQAEDLGVDVAFNWDHFFPLSGGRDGKHFECWTMLAAWAEQTTRIEIGALVTCNSYRNPDLLADMARTVDHISEGRLILGIGSGWFEHDYTEYGYAFGTAGGRLDALGEALPRIESRLARLNPRPTRDIPVLIGGGGEKKTLRLVAQHADVWHTFSDGDELRHKIEVLHRHCADIGRDPAEIEVSVNFLGGPEREEQPEVEGEQLRALGATLFTVGLTGPDYDFTAVRRWLAWRDEVNATS